MTDVKLPRDWHLLRGEGMHDMVRCAGPTQPGLRRYEIMDELGRAHLAEVHAHRTHLPLLPGYRPSQGQASEHALGLSPTLRAWLRPYQLDAVGFVTNRSGTIIADDLGLGKTPIASASCGEAYTTIVCPSSAICVWEQECLRMGWTYKVLDKKVDRLELRYAPPQVQALIISYNLLPALAGSLVLGSKWQTHTLIADEAHQLTNKHTTWASMFRLIHRERTILLTATPMRNRLRSLWGLLDCACYGAFGSEWDFRQHFCGARPGAYGLEDHEPTHQDELAKRLQECVVKRTRAQVQIPLPKHTREVIECSIDSHELMGALLRTGLNDAGKRPAEALRALGALRLVIGQAKARQAARMLRGWLEQHHRVILWVWHQDVAKILERFAPDPYYAPCDVLLGDTHSKKRTEIVNEWRTGDPSKRRVLIASIGAAATAISLTTARAAVFVELDWTPMNLIQAEKRHYRFGNVFPDVTTYYMVSQVGVDQQMMCALLEKAAASETALGQDGSLEQMRALLDEEEPAPELLATRWLKDAQ